MNLYRTDWSIIYPEAILLVATWLTLLYTLWLTSISAWKYFLVDLFGWLLLYFQVDFHISQETLLVDLFGWLSFIHSCWLSYQSFGWLLGWLCSLHFGWLSYQPGNTFHIRLTFLVDFLLYILVDLFYQLVWLTFWLTINWLTLLHNLVDLRISQEILSSFLRD